YQRFSHLHFTRASRFSELRGKSRNLLLALAPLLLLWILFPAPIETAFKKIIIPWKNFQDPLPVKLQNLSGSETILKDDPVELRGTYSGVQPDQLFLILQHSDSMNAAGGPAGEQTQRVALQVNPSGEFNYRISHVRHPFRYYFQANIEQPRFRNRPALSEAGVIRLQERPVIRNLQLKVSPPAYTRLPAKLLEPNQGEVTALKGSEVQLRLESDKQLTGGFLQFSDSSQLPLQVAGHTASAAFTVNKNVNYFMRIFDSDSIDNGETVEYSVFPLSDEYPFAEIKQPGADLDLENELTVPVFVEIRDDFGFSGLWIKGEVYRLGSSGDTSSFEVKLPVKTIEAGKGFSEIQWDLTSFYLIPDDYLSYYAEVRDNDIVSGPKSFKTGRYVIRIPSLLDVLAEAEQTQTEQMENVENVVKETEEIRDKLEEINRELKKEVELSWEQKQEVKKQLERQKESLKKLDDIQKSVDEMVQQLDRNQALSPETLDKYFQLQEMFEELASPELKEAMQKLQEALEKTDPKQLQQAMERFQFSVEQFEKNIERTYELFKRVELEQKMDELVRMAEKMGEEQQKINEKLKEETSPEEMEQMAQSEKNLQKESEALNRKIEETGQDYQELMKELSEMLEQAGQFMEEQEMSSQMEQMQQQLSQQQSSQAQKQGENLKSQMDMLQSMLQQARQQMQSRQKQELAEEMQKTLQDLLATSFAQENLAQQSRQLSPASPQVGEVAGKQSRLQESTQQIIRQMVEIANKTFFVSPQMSQIMNSIMSQMDNAVRQLENRRASAASQAQLKAMAGFNQALLSLQNSMNQMSQGSSASGFQEFMQQLQQMAGQQGQLNQQTMGMFQKQQGGRMPVSSDQMGRMAAQQEMIRKSMEKLSNESGDRRDVLGRLGELGEEMEKVVENLKRQQLDRDLIERQERILSRLLDAQKSIREKEHSKKRQAEREQVATTKSPPGLREAMLKKEDRLRKEMLRALEEGYTAEYRQLIKQYFENLSRNSESIP
ncbi:MAG: DUF4175 family protein, partial [Calditrichia bacterium]